MANKLNNTCSRIIPIIIIMGIFFIQNGYAQVLKVVDSTTQVNLSSFNLKTANNKLISNGQGIIRFDKKSNERIIIINYQGYKSKSFVFPANDTTVFLTENIIRLGEVVISNIEKKIAIVGNFEKKTNNVFANGKIDKDIDYTIVNKFDHKNEPIRAILFYIAKDQNYAKSNELSPVEVVFFKAETNGIPSKEPFYKILITNYAIGWNKVLLDDFTTGDDSILFYGIKWIYSPTKYHYQNIKGKKTYYFFGSKLGSVSLGKLNDSSHQTFFFNNEIGWKKSFIPAMMALEITK